MKKYLFLFLYLFIAALNYNLILKPLKLVTGGTQGLSLIITSFINIKDSIVILLINVTTLLLRNKKRRDNQVKIKTNKQGMSICRQDILENMDLIIPMDWQ